MWEVRCVETLIQIALLSAVIVVALAISVAISKRVTKIILTVTTVIAAIGGFIIYGYTYSVLCESAVLASVRTILAVIRSFAGANYLADVLKVPELNSVPFQIFYWIVQLLSVFSTLSVALATFGANLLQNLRLRFSVKQDLYIIYGLDENGFQFAQNVRSDRNVSLAFVDPKPDPGLAASAKHSGMAVKTDTDALCGTVRFLRGIGAARGSRKIHIFALNTDSIADQIFARNVLRSLQALNVPSERTALTILGDEDDTENQLFHSQDSYGYGNVFSVNKPYLTARLLMGMAPPCKTISFDKAGKAAEDFHGLLIGCDRVGQAVLRQIVMNSQFEGSGFRLTVFAINVDEAIGRMAIENAQMLSQYDIQFHSHDGRSKAFYEYLDQNVRSLKYIVLCTGNKSRNMEIAQQLQPYLRRRGCALPIYQCEQGVVRYVSGSDRIVENSIYTSEVLCSDTLDETAIALNHTYCGSGNAKENWAKCDYFSRMSSRASADFLPAMLHMSGVTPEKWCQDTDLLENLAKTEHKRWCAFHYAMGFSKMPNDVWNKRAEIFREELARTGSGRIRIGKDLDRRMHACLIDWEDLDELSARESQVTGKPVDYKQMDRNNVLTLDAACAKPK